MGNALGVLQDGTSIKIKVENGRITDTLPDTLKELYCGGNKLTELPTLPDTLVQLDCSDNNLTALPTLPDTLVGLYCSDNNLKALPTLPDTLKVLYCIFNNLTEVPTLPDSLKELSLGYNNYIDSESIFTSETGYVFVKQNYRYYSVIECGMTAEKAKKVMFDLECYDAILHFGL